MSEPTVTESVNPQTTTIDELDTVEQVALMNAQDAGVATAVGAQAGPIARTIDAVAARLADGGRLFYVGAGTAGRLGILDASEIPPTFGLPPERVVGLIAGGTRAIQHAVENAEDDADQGAADLRTAGVDRADAVIGIAASGRTPYVLGALTEARELGCFTAALSCNPDSPIAAAADVGIEVVVGPEVISGSTRLKSGTAQKMVLNMISTLVMVKLGKTYGNLMVDVVASNAKLHQRSERLVTMVTGVDNETATTTLARAGGSVKTALAMLLTDQDAEAATRLLAAHDGVLKHAVAAAGR